MPDRNPYELEAFRHHNPILTDDVIPRIIPGRDGAFGERLQLEGLNNTEPSVGVVVEFTMAGALTGCRMLKCGKVTVKDVSSKKIWPDAEEATLVIPEFDLSDFGDSNGLMSTTYAELPFKVMEKQGESWKALKKGELVTKGYSDLSFRLHVRTVDTEKVKLTLVALPCALAEVASAYGESVGSRGFPGIKIHEGRARLVTREEAEHKFGIGVEPFYLVTNAKMDEASEIVTEGLRVPASMDMKKAVVSLLQSGVSPNCHLERGHFDEVVKGKKWKKKEPKFAWPDPIEEDDKDTSDEETDRGDSGKNGLSLDDISQTESDLLAGVQEELGVGGGGAEYATSPVRRAAGRVKEPSKRPSPSSGLREGRTPSKKKKKNSDLYAKEKRPELFRDDEVFNSLNADKAGKVCYLHFLEEKKDKRKAELKNSKEKCDDVIKSVMIPGGADDAKNNLNVEARKLMRPVVKDISKMMEWFPTSHTDIIRNLPMFIYGLQDGLSTKAIELAHDLSNTIEIKMFSPANLRSSASKQSQKAFADKDGKLTVEQNDEYEDMRSVNDVLLAWNTLDSVWQKLFPEWPVAKIGLRVILVLRSFAHCAPKSKEVMVAFSNRYLAANANRAANRETPMPYDKAMIMAGNVCYHEGFAREAPAKPQPFQMAYQPFQTPYQAGPSTTKKATGGVRNGARAAGGPGNAVSSRPSNYRLPDGSIACRFFQLNTCRFQASPSCSRPSGPHKHVCLALKKDGSFCGGRHSRTDHK